MRQWPDPLESDSYSGVLAALLSRTAPHSRGQIRAWPSAERFWRVIGTIYVLTEDLTWPNYTWISLDGGSNCKRL